MNRTTTALLRKARVTAMVCAMIAPLWTAEATRHTITFTSYSYSPSSLTVSVGDTIVWQGDFVFHPMSSATIPFGAASWHFTSGTSQSYVVTIAGSYTYGCDAHSLCCNMTASFNAVAVSVDENPNSPLSFRLEQNFPNPFNPTTTIRYSISASQVVTLKVFDVAGQDITTLVNEKQPAGHHVVEFDAGRLASGIYLCRMETEGYVTTRKLLLIK